MGHIDSSMEWNRPLCEVLTDMRTIVKVFSTWLESDTSQALGRRAAQIKEYEAGMQSLIETVQVLGNQIESVLYDARDISDVVIQVKEKEIAISEALVASGQPPLELAEDRFDRFNTQADSPPSGPSPLIVAIYRLKAVMQKYVDFSLKVQEKGRKPFIDDGRLLMLSLIDEAEFKAGRMYETAKFLKSYRELSLLYSEIRQLRKTRIEELKALTSPAT